MSERAGPVGTREIASYHAHIYFRTSAEREAALALRSCLAERFLVQLGRVHDVPVGPHSVAMYQVAFAVDTFASLVPWLMLNRAGLSILVHPNTGRARDDHLQHALWLGSELAVHGAVLSNDPHDVVSSPEPNTTPHLPSA